MRRALLFAVLCGCSLGAAADLYRWVDPETGSIKYSSYPPPWYGDPARERGKPKVERIPAGYGAPPPAEADEPGKAGPAPGTPAFQLGSLDARRKTILQLLASLPQREDFARSGAGFQQHLLAYQAVTAEMDRLDPKGAAARRAESQPIIDKLREGLRALGGAAPPPVAKPQAAPPPVAKPPPAAPPPR
jgi:hypothetical protein